MTADDPIATQSSAPSSPPAQAAQARTELGPPTQSHHTGPLLEVRHLSKRFGSVTALSDASLSAAAGEVTAIVGDNGAGKSTLVKCISGVHRANQGEILLDGEKVDFVSPQQSRSHGVETVYQDLALIEDMAIWQNMYLNRELTRRLGPVRVLRRAEMRRGATGMLAQLQVKVPSVNTRVRRLSGGQRQGVAICRAVAWGANLLILDEPTAALGVQETTNVERLVTRLRDDGLGILLVSHNLEQVMRLSDQVWVLRHGKVVSGRRTAETNGQQLVASITGAMQAA